MEAPSVPSLVRQRAVALVVGSTVLVTLALLGIVAILRGQVVGQGGRLPIYLFGSSVVFVALVFTFERRGFDGRRIITSTLGLTLVGGTLLFLVGEGTVYVLTYYEEVFSTQLVLYLLSIGLVWTGIVYWGLSHWREFVSG
ncbi:hypothetical protein ACFPYI_12600 [Halomarina salina]|uniref:Uncharacterized protein n=1 Tax=Halomarina salina TaxID=1872699 RepID=A0ABD5RNE5_9EURY|nr:hypothetical protein [Halomarina salina]